MAVADVVLKGELHTSSADLDEAKELLLDGVDVLVLEGSESPLTSFDLSEGWFALSIAFLFWVLDSVYVSNSVLVDLANAQGTEVVYTRETDTAIADNVSFPVKAVAAAIFYLLLPASIWSGFLTGSQLFGAYLLFLGLVMPVGIVRAFDGRGRDTNRDQYIANEIMGAIDRGDCVLAIVGAAHVSGVRDRLPDDDVRLEVRPPIYGVWSRAHLREIALPMFKAGLLLFSVYLLAVWIVVQAVGAISPVVELLVR